VWSAGRPRGWIGYRVVDGRAGSGPHGIRFQPTRLPFAKPRISPYWSAGLRPKDFRDETVRRPWEGSTAGPASIRSPLPHTQDRKPRITLVDQARNGFRPLIRPTEPKDGLRGSETSFMNQEHGVQCKACGQSISTGIAELSLPIQVRPVHCPYCRQEHFYLEHDRIEFDPENGLPLIDPA
jgi:hypothetical protein